MNSNIKKFEQKEIDTLSSQFFNILISLREYIINPTIKIDINSIKESISMEMGESDIDSLPQ